MGIKSFLCGAFLAAVATQPYWAQDPVETRRALKAQGMTAISVGSCDYFEYGWFEAPCDLHVTRFEAETTSGKRVTGYYSSSPWSKYGRLHIKQRIY